eukprot:6176985-Pleurochrysis_carterae.AAC.1
MNGSSHVPDGSSQAPDGTNQVPDGSRWLPDGNEPQQRPASDAAMITVEVWGDDLERFMDNDPDPGSDVADWEEKRKRLKPVEDPCPLET